MKAPQEIGFKGKFAIPVGGNTDGEQRFEFQLDDQFLTSFGNPDLLGGSVNASVSVHKSGNSMIVGLRLKGQITIPCDYCLEPFVFPIDKAENLVFSLGEKVSQEEEVIILAKDAVEIDLSQDLYDMVALEIPIRKQHPPDANGEPTCDPQMLELLKKYIIK